MVAYSTKFFARSVIVGRNIKTSFKEVLSIKPETAGKIKYGSWGLIGGAVIAMIIGFGWGGWNIMPGQKEAVNGVAQACSDGLALLVSK